MKNIFKSALATTAAVAAVAGGVIAPVAQVSAADANAGRNWPMYSLQRINEGVLGNTIAFNSIHIQDSDYAWHKNTYGEDIPTGTITNESNFVGARENTGINAGANNVWNGDRIKVEEGKSYIVRLYVHNNNPNGEQAIAENTRVSFNIPSTSAREVTVNGYIYSDSASVNGYPYMDNVIFESATGESFHLEYVKGSALLENQADYNTVTTADGKKQVIGFKLSDNIVEAASIQGVKIGYKLGADGQPNGQVPGCYQYDSFVTIEVKPVFDREFTVSKQVRVVGAEDQTWKPSVDAKIGDIVEFRIEYVNKSGYNHNNVGIRDVLPDNLEYIPGSTKLKNNGDCKNWCINKDDTIATEGINIGHYAPNSNAIIYLRAKVVDNSLACGSNTLVNWGQGYVTINGEKIMLQDYARVNLDKIEGCPVDPEDPSTPVDPGTEDPNLPSELPTTGPEAIVGGVVATGAIVTAAGYYIASRRQLRR